MKAARRLIFNCQHQTVSPSCKEFHEADELPAGRPLRLTDRALWESIPPMRPIWKGSISFGLVYIPVRFIPPREGEA